MSNPGTSVTRRELAALQHDLEGPLTTFGGFLAELHAAVDALERLGEGADEGQLEALLEEDFKPCLKCLDDSLARLRSTTARLVDPASVQTP